MKIAYIGGGASALFSAFYLSKISNHQITIYEKTAKSGRKINSSGNGRGNLSNVNLAKEKYNNPAFVEPLIKDFTADDFRALMLEHGLLTIVDGEGRIYPYGHSAQIFSNLLLKLLKQNNVEIINNQEVVSLTYENDFIINGSLHYDKVVIATGSHAGLAPSLKSFALEQILQYFNIHTTDYFPTLASVGVSEAIKEMSGRRTDANIKVIIDGSEVYQTSGEVLFRKDALSGIAIFECSSILTWHYRKNKKIKAQIILDIMPEFNEAEVYSFLNKQEVDGRVDLDGIFYPTINEYLMNCVGSKRTAKAMAKLIKNLTFNVNFNYIPDNNQVYSGGVRLNEVDPLTLESKRVPGLYFSGEVLDIDGLCGGYNLHWAWASGVGVAKAINH